MTERHEEYMKRRIKEEQHNKIYESPDKGKTVYERDFGSTKRNKIKDLVDSFVEDAGDIDFVYTESGALEIKIPETPKYKYNEDNLIKEFKAYIDETYNQHYSLNKFQATEFIIDSGHGDGFCLGNVMKYAQRYGKKNGHNRDDILKVLHYALIELYIHDKNNRS